MHRLLCLLVLTSSAVAQEPAPTPPPLPPEPLPVVQAMLVAKDVPGTGKRNDPYLFTASHKCVLRLTAPDATPVAWDVTDAPSDIEVIGQVAIFSLSEPGTYVIYVRGDGWHAKAWFVIQSGAPPPPVPDLVQRTKAALQGPDAKSDAARFGAVCDELTRALETGTITRLAGMESSLQAGLAAVGWQPGKYPALSDLAGKLFGRNVPDRALDTETIKRFAAQLRLISRACEEVSR